MNRKAVAIAKDVLKQLDTLCISKGNYITGWIPESDNLTKKADAQKHLKTIKRNCHVCALGACVISYVKLYDNVKLEAIGFGAFGVNSFDASGLSLRKILKNVFTAQDIALIEIVFEKSTYSVERLNDKYVEQGAVLFGRKYEDSKLRLKQIMRNIIRNNGTFKVPKIYIKQAKIKEAEDWIRDHGYISTGTSMVTNG